MIGDSGYRGCAMVLETELRFYETHRQEFLQHYRNLFVLIKKDELIGVFPDAQTAHREGINRFGLEPFLVKQVLEVEPISVSPVASLLAASGGL